MHHLSGSTANLACMSHSYLMLQTNIWTVGQLVSFWLYYDASSRCEWPRLSIFTFSKSTSQMMCYLTLWSLLLLNKSRCSLAQQLKLKYRNKYMLSRLYPNIHIRHLEGFVHFEQISLNGASRPIINGYWKTASRVLQRWSVKEKRGRFYSRRL